MKTHSKVLFMALAALVLLAGCKKQNSEKRITKFAFTSLNVEATILESTKIIKATVPMGTNVTALEPWIVVSSMASVSPASGVAQNFSRPVTYTVTASDVSDFLVDCHIFEVGGHKKGRRQIVEVPDSYSVSCF